MGKKNKEKTDIRPKLKKILIIILFIALLILVQRLIYHKLAAETAANEIANQKVEENSVSENKVEEPTSTNNPEVVEGLKVAATMSDEIYEDATWCGTMQLAWNEMLKKYGDDIVFQDSNSVIENLNKKEFTENDVSAEDTYQTYGLSTVSEKERVEKAIKEKFNETSDVLDLVEWFENEEEADGNYFFYSILKKVFTFKYEFEELDNGNFENDKYTDVEYFGVYSGSEEEIKKQVRVLYYENDEDFAVMLQTKEGEKVILCNNPQGKNFNEIYNKIKENEDLYTGIRVLEDVDDFKMPNIDIDLLEEYSDLENKIFITSDEKEVMIKKAIQTIQFKLDRKGGTLKSEAIITTMESAAIAEPEVKTPRHFYLDDSFVMFLVEEGKDTPYYAAKITDITKFQK